MQVDISSFRQRPATTVVSLGSRCSVAYNLRRYFDFKSAYPFDWWITPDESLPKLLQNLDSDYVYDHTELELTEGNRSVRHKGLRILLHHEFPRHWKAPGEPVIDDFIKYVETPKRRTSYLLSKFMDLNKTDERILFVRECANHQSLSANIEKLFSKATWCLYSVPIIQEDKENGWKCSPQLWDKVLVRSGVVLDPARHDRFIETQAHHTDDDLV